MPIYNITPTVTVRNAQVASDADIDPTKLAYSGMGVWCRKTTAQAIADATQTQVNFGDSEHFDIVPSGYSGIHDPSSNPSRFVMRQRGLWLATGILFYEQQIGTGSSRYAYIMVNGVTNVIANQVLVGVSNKPNGVFISALYYTTTNTDYLSLAAYHDFGSSVNVGDYGPGTFFGIAFLGDNQ